MTSAESAQSLAQHVQDRMRDLGLTQASIAAAGGPSPATLRQLFQAAAAGRPFKDMQIDTLAKFDRSLQWEPGSTRDVLAGGQPRVTGGVGVLRGHDPEMGAYAIAVPRHVLAELDALDPLARAEAQASVAAYLLGKVRELRQAQVD